jgi:hypothetical protein
LILYLRSRRQRVELQQMSDSERREARALLGEDNAGTRG